MTAPHKPQFIVLCGPTGVGKSRVPKEIFKLEDKDYTKIEIDTLVVQNQLYISTIYTINKLDENLIVNTITGKNPKTRQLLTNLFNILYLNVKNNVIPCVKNDPKTENITCSQLHDKLLAEAINEKKTIVLEINGDKDFSWLFIDTNDNGLFTNKHRRIIRKKYQTTICYLSHNYITLLESNKKRFLDNIKECVPKSCSARLGNFLLPNIYHKTISSIFKVYDDLLKLNFFKNNNIAVSFYERTKENNYLKLEDFDKYKESFKLTIVPSLPLGNKESLHAIISKGFRKSRRKPKKQNPKSKTQKVKSKNI